MERNSWAADAVACLPLCEAVYSDSRSINSVLDNEFSCSICHQPFLDMTEFVHHVQSHTEEKPNDDKEELDVSEESQKSDSQTVHPKFTCAICLLSFPNDISLINHVSRHAADDLPITNSEASDCQANAEATTVSNRNSSLNLKDLLYACAICDKSFNSNKDLALHVKGHSSACDIEVTVGVPHIQETVDIRQPVTRSLTKGRHSLSVMQPYSSKRRKLYDLLSFQCNVCNKYFKNAITLKCHKKTHAVDEDSKAESPTLSSTLDLDKAIKRESAVENGGEILDSVVSTFECAICSKLFTNESALIAHVSQHASSSKHECTTCHKTFKCHSHLLRHEHIHLGVRPFACPVCPSTFSRRSHLSTHLRLHRGERPFPCTTCNKTFTDGSNLAKHLRLHSEEKSHRCEICNRVFGRSDTLAKHRRSHSGLKPYQCQLCARLFPRQDSLARHLKSHRGEKPHQCIVCSKAFTQKYDLTLHYRTHARNFTLPVGWGLDSLSMPELPAPETR